MPMLQPSLREDVDSYVFFNKVIGVFGLRIPTLLRLNRHVRDIPSYSLPHCGSIQYSDY